VFALCVCTLYIYVDYRNLMLSLLFHIAFWGGRLGNNIIHFFKKLKNEIFVKQNKKKQWRIKNGNHKHLILKFFRWKLMGVSFYFNPRTIIKYIVIDKFRNLKRCCEG
jgi:hypothetical protein